MPSWEDHVKFVESHPYEAWYFISSPDTVGACYLTKQDEIGVFISKENQGNGYGKKAVQAIMQQHGPRRYLAHINALNERSMLLFSNLGFKTISHTMAFTS